MDTSFLPVSIIPLAREFAKLRHMRNFICLAHEFLMLGTGKRKSPLKSIFLLLKCWNGGCIFTLAPIFIDSN